MKSLVHNIHNIVGAVEIQYIIFLIDKTGNYMQLHCWETEVKAADINIY